jgi:carbonic anhydrase/acetyltransferase-like protein (isoleucine patch superfamily)
LPVYALGDAEPRIHPSAYVHPDAVVIGQVEIGAESTIWPAAVLRGDDGRILIGEATSIQDGTIIHTTAFQPTTVGNRCVVGHNVHLEGCIVEDGSLVGSGSVVLHGAIVRTGALVGANALVPNGMEIPTGAMGLGVPARLREGTVTPGQFEEAVVSYVERGRRFRTELRRIS